MTDDPIKASGQAINPDELEGSDKGIEAILPDDRIVLVTDWMRIYVGAAGTGESTTRGNAMWGWDFIRQAAQGTYRLVRSLPDAINKEATRRKQERKSFRRFLQQVRFLGAQCMDDDMLSKEIMETGIDEWLQSQ